MEKIFIISDKTNLWYPEDNAIQIIDASTEKFELDKNCHDWIVKIFADYNPSNIIIPLKIGEDKFSGLILGMHIRLNQDLTHVQKTIPIVFVSNEHTFETIFADKDIEIKKSRALPHYLLTTQNVYLEEPNIEAIIEILKISKPITIADYKNKFLDMIKVLPSTGKHSIANIWGAFQFARYSGYQNILNQNNKNLNAQKDLYFKYILAYSLKEERSNENIGNISPIEIKTNGKKILFFDDEADKGWGQVLEKIFSDSDFKSISKSEDETYDEFIDKAKKELNGSIDILILDLRLKPEEDEKEGKTAKDFTGTEFLKMIKGYHDKQHPEKSYQPINQGIQVIVFTASNKAWNMRELLDMGADGYYIKESPEHALDENFSKENFQNFIEDAIRCSYRTYLKTMYNIHNDIYEYYNHSNDDLIKEIIAHLKLSYQLLSLVDRYENIIAYSFINYFKIFDILIDKFIDKRPIENKKVEWYVSSQIMKRYDWNHNNQLYEVIGDMILDEKKYPEYFQKIISIAKVILKLDDSWGKRLFRNQFIDKRNDFIHKNINNINPSDCFEIAKLLQEAIKRIPL